MKWQWHKIAMAVVIGSMLVTGCGNGSGSQNSSDSKQEGAVSTAAQQTAEKSKPKGTVFTSLDGTMQLTLPSSWRQNDELNNMAQFAAYHRSNNRFALVGRTLKADLEDGATVDDIVDRTISNADAITLDDMEVIATRDTSVGPDPAKQLEFRGINKNGTKEKVHYLVTTMEKGDNFYQIVFWTKESKFDKYKEEFEQATETFKVLNASDSEAPAAAPAKPKVIKSADSRMELTVTANWMEYPLNEDAEISAFYPAGNEYVIVIPDDREEMGDIQTLEDYYDLLYEYNYSEFASGGAVEEPKSVNINGLPALQFEIQGVSEDKEKLAMLITLIESPQQFTQVIFWTTQSNIEQKRERFIEAAASYKEHAQ
ncbi:photosystem II reaction center PsbP family protein [Paenibacillus thiaminolyticus]|uniref:PsbP-related protein n=1 Tax=Paenibacillus thiaminolyticus TaxID=49283 RepID=UPI00232AAA45|nr:PsbP-related protein [Paenibacillus thiaminolyticus]WCF08472.1 photosystem II reaction center PsbP family protein [Paenibacillus thiaminolyticus]